jgi:hypothetical protein
MTLVFSVDDVSGGAFRPVGRRGMQAHARKGTCSRRGLNMETMVGAWGFRCLFSDRAWTKEVSGAQEASASVCAGVGAGDGDGVAEGSAVGIRGRGDSARECGGGFLRTSWKRVRGGRMSGMDRGCDTGGSIEFGMSAEGSGRDSTSGGSGDGQ